MLVLFREYFVDPDKTLAMYKTNASQHQIPWDSPIVSSVVAVPSDPRFIHADLD